jgi:hypothetical protein
MISSGPRLLFLVSTAAGEFFEKLALLASNSGFPGPGMVQRSNNSSDSASAMALPKA